MNGMVKYFAFAATLLAPLASVAADSPSDFSAQVRQASPSVVMIEAVNSSGRNVRGAGFIFDSKGRIATAFHVVENATAIHLHFSDGRKAAGQLTAHDVPHDLALLTADAPVLSPPLRIAALAPAPGAPVVAIGFPFGHAFSVSAGVVSGLDRTYDQQTPHGFLQHDAALNPGSSGGPLLDVHGEVIGINTAIPNGRRSDVGVGFAIPGNVVSRVLAALDRDGAIKHGFIGARLRVIDHALAAALQRKAGGAIVEETDADGPAQKAGLRAGDIVVAVDGRHVESLRQISEAVTGGAPGATIAFSALRDGAPLVANIVLGAQQTTPAVAHAREGDPSLLNTGIEFAGSAPVTIKSVAPASPAASVGLRRGDAILAIGNKTIADASEAHAALAAIRSQRIALLVRRASMGSRYVIIGGATEGLAGSPLNGNREAEGSLPF